MKGSVTEYRRQASHAREMAKKAVHPSSREEWLHMAEEFEKLARSVEIANKARGEASQ